ncbi:hypothetical protein HHK36_028623 [Tetracentron sinense]|uniref:Uncharacterized protein n=1 Tax=Tetracentron sinense TaxID=13715 RepID=A0A834YGM6_TETSI|nr:hypothetical protein HHK36_028623 [Tetracentron sinense]
MASIAIPASLKIACSSHHVIKKQQSQAKPGCCFGAKQATHVVTVDVEGKRMLNIAEQQENASVHNKGPKGVEGESEHVMDTGSSVPKLFHDARWKNGTWDLNMFVKDGKMDWDGVIVAEARRRKFLEMHPQVSTNQAPVLFRSSIIPWWAWIMRSHLPEAELLNGRAAMVGFFAAYLVDALTGLDMVGQTGNFICKTGLFMIVLGIILFRRTKDLGNLQKLVDEATFYDKQWQASWQNPDASNGTSEQSQKDYYADADKECQECEMGNMGFYGN